MRDLADGFDFITDILIVIFLIAGMFIFLSSFVTI